MGASIQRATIGDLGRFLCPGISSYSYSAWRYSHSTGASDRLVARWIHRVSIEPIGLSSICSDPRFPIDCIAGDKYVVE